MKGEGLMRLFCNYSAPCLCQYNVSPFDGKGKHFFRNYKIGNDIL